VSKKILIVDDSPTDIRLMSIPLKAKGYEVSTAADGDEALTKAIQIQPNLVILDVVMPKKDGFQVCRQLKANPETKGIKVILLTSKSQKSDRFWGLKQGADVYLTKPFAEEELLGHINQLT
jgi:twitching motility two-component system response regulator PilH